MKVDIFDLAGQPYFYEVTAALLLGFEQSVLYYILGYRVSAKQ